MKFNGKILSVCALLVATSACKGSAPFKQTDLGQTMYIKVENNTGNPIFGSVYKTSMSGKVIAQSNEPENAFYYTIENGKCLQWTVYKSLDRLSKYHTLIFATNESALKQKFLFNKNSAEVKSENIPQSLIKSNEARTECYQVTYTSKKLQIKKSKDGCSSCQGVPTPSTTINSIDIITEVSRKPTWSTKLSNVFKRKPKTAQTESGTELSSIRQNSAAATKMAPKEQQSTNYETSGEGSSDSSQQATMHLPGSGSMEEPYTSNL